MRHDSSPEAAGAFLQRVRVGYYDGCFVCVQLIACISFCLILNNLKRFSRFRVLKGFIAQFGLRQKWDGPEFKRVKTLKRPTEHGLSNVRGTLAFAGASPTQVFVNLGNNARLDSEVEKSSFPKHHQSTPTLIVSVQSLMR